MTETKRRQAGCCAGRMPLNFHHGLLAPRCPVAPRLRHEHGTGAGPTRRRDETEDSARRFVLVPSGVSHKWLDTSRAGHVRRTVLIHPIQAISCRSPRNILGADAPVQPGARRKHTGSSRPTSNTAGYSGGRMYADFCNEVRGTRGTPPPSPFVAAICLVSRGPTIFSFHQSRDISRCWCTYWAQAPGVGFPSGTATVVTVAECEAVSSKDPLVPNRRSP